MLADKLMESRAEINTPSYRSLQDEDKCLDCGLILRGARGDQIEEFLR